MNVNDAKELLDGYDAGVASGRHDVPALCLANALRLMMSEYGEQVEIRYDLNVRMGRAVYLLNRSQYGLRNFAARVRNLRASLNEARVERDVTALKQRHDVNVWETSSDGWKKIADSRKAENARLQARVRELELSIYRLTHPQED